MSKRIPKFIIEDILECINKILSYTESINFEEFLKDSKTREAVYRNFEVIGEAANRLPEEYLDKHDEIEWHKIISTRNVIIHGYDEIDDSIIWNIIQTNLPDLRNKLEKLF